jgi:site-specific DNA-cytosine methylase
MDNTGESRATVIAFSHTNGLDPQPSATATATAKGHSSLSVVQSDEIAGPLTALGMGNAKGTETTDSHHYALQGATVRRLTPVECERLQGFPDGWTKYRLNEKGEVVEQADSARYKQMGNAVAVPVVEWLVERLLKYDKP